MRIFTRGAYFVLLVCSGYAAYAQTDVLTQHNDLNRSGWNNHESILNTSNVNTNSFGLVAVRPVDDQIYAQPLVVNGVNINKAGTLKNIVYVATVGNSIYAFDADDTTSSGTYYWKVNLTPSGCRAPNNKDIHPSLCNFNYHDFFPTYLRGTNSIDTVGRFGIVGTPVIDKTNNILYVVSRYVDTTRFTIDQGPHMRHDCVSGTNVDTDTAYSNKGFFQALHAIDLRTGQEINNGTMSSPVIITASASGTTGGASFNGVTNFDPRRNSQRGGLALNNGIVYIPYAAHCDWDNSHGWILAYDAGTLSQKMSYITTPNDARGGIWMSGSAPVIDAGGNIYFTTGNARVGNNQTACTPGPDDDFPNDAAHSPSVTVNRGESVIKLTPNSGNTALNISDYFTPFDYQYKNDADLDFPIQIMLIPNTNLLVTGCKDNNLYLMDASNLGGFNTSSNNILQQFSVGTNAQMHSSLAYFGGTAPYVYQFSENTALQAFPVQANKLGSAIVSGISGGPAGTAGAFMSVSSNGTDTSTAILWINQAYEGCNANQGPCNGNLRAVKAANINQEIWNSNTNYTDNYGYFSKMNCPTVANGKVYLPTQSNQFVIYGLKPFSSCGTDVAAGKTAHASSFTSPGTAAQNAFDGNITTRWESFSNDHEYLYVDLGSLYNICSITINWQTGIGKAFGIDISSDTTLGWTNIDTITNNTNFNYVKNGSWTARYVKMQGGARGTLFGYSIWEMQVFGTAANLCQPPNLLTPVVVDQNDETVIWNKVPGATGYDIQYKVPLDYNWITRSATDTTLILSALTCNGETYNYQVKAVCSSGPSTASSGSFLTAACNPTCNPLPTRHFHADIGDIGIAGNSCLISTNASFNVISVSASGSGIGGNTDQFQYAFMQLSGDEQISAQVVSQTNATMPYNKAGLMMRDSMSITSRFMFIGLNSSNGMILVYRSTPGGPTDSVNLAGFTAPYWVKLSKTGTQFSAFISSDGITWVPFGTTLNLGFGSGTINTGMAVSSASNGVLSSAIFDFFDPSTPLPVHLINFTASNVSNEYVSLNWATAMEVNNDHFDVEKSTSAMNFETLTTVKAVGNSDITQYYSAKDPAPAQGTNYYRLKQVDMDGKFSYSQIRPVNFGRQADPIVYPNPATTFVNVVAGMEPVKLVTVYNSLGGVVQQLDNASGSSTLTVSMANRAAGVYFMQIRTASQVYYQKIIKE